MTNPETLLAEIGGLDDIAVTELNKKAVEAESEKCWNAENIAEPILHDHTKQEFIEWWNELDEKSRQRFFRHRLHIGVGLCTKQEAMDSLVQTLTLLGLNPPEITPLSLRLMKFEFELWQKNLLRNVMGPSRYTRAVLLDAFDKCMEDLNADDDKGKPVLSAATALSALCRATQQVQPADLTGTKPPTEQEFDAALGL